MPPHEGASRARQPLILKLDESRRRRDRCASACARSSRPSTSAARAKPPSSAPQAKARPPASRHPPPNPPAARPLPRQVRQGRPAHQDHPRAEHLARVLPAHVGVVRPPGRAGRARLTSVGNEAIELGKRYVHNDICFPAQIDHRRSARRARQRQNGDPHTVAIGTGKYIGDCRLTHYSGAAAQGARRRRLRLRPHHHQRRRGRPQHAPGFQDVARQRHPRRVRACP